MTHGLDAYHARQHPLDRGVDTGQLTVIGDRDGGTLLPDGTANAVQQINARAEKPLTPR